ncbi:MAG: amidase [Chloroflexi bacterium]|nr:amidase [Chloroflexota bacterium]
MLKHTDTIKLISALRQGKIEIIDYLAELEEHFNRREPEVLAFLPEEDRFARLRLEADALRKRYPHPEARPPLYGFPTGVKDIFHVEGFPTHAGSQLPPEILTGPEAACVTALKNAGALIFGKTVTTEFAYFAPGPTHNPHNLAHTPGGSSSGSAAAVAAGLVPFAFGTQTIGSITRPASYCGVVGFKPSYDRISKAGVIPLASSLDHIGFFTPDIASAQMMASILCQGWCETSTVRKPVLGVPDGPYLRKADAEMLAHFETVCQRLQSAGYQVKRVPAMPDYDDISARHNLITAAEAARTHQTWFPEYGDLYHPKTGDLIRRGQATSPERLAEALQGCEQLRDELTALMDEYSIDLWLSPSAPGAAPRGLDSTGDPVMNLPWTHSGLPTLNIPSGFNEAGLPLGLQVAARWYADEALLQWALELEALVS